MKRSRTAAAWAIMVSVAAAQPVAADEIVFVSTQLRPIEETQKVRDVILDNFDGTVNYYGADAAQLDARMRAEGTAGQRTIDLVGALHGELQPLAATELDAIDDVAAGLADRGIPASLMDLGKLGTDKQLYIPWMQATFVMVARRDALEYLPQGVDVNRLTYEQLEAWAKAISDATGQRALGFPAGPRGLMHRFLQGYLYPSYTGGMVTTFRSAEAEAMWSQFKRLWQYVNPKSTSYDFMQDPLLSDEVWIAFDHVARLKDALVELPDEFVAFPAPTGPKGRGYMPVIVGLAIPKDARDRAGAAALIDYLTTPETQIVTAQQVGFFPVVKAELPADLEPGIRQIADAVAKTQGADDAIAALLPVGLADQSNAFNQVFLDTFRRIVLRNEAPRAVLDEEAKALSAVMVAADAPCWQPDPPSQSACPVK